MNYIFPCIMQARSLEKRALAFFDILPTLSKYFILSLTSMIARLQRMFSQWIRAIRIFPLPSLILIAMSILGIAMVYLDGGDTDSLMRLMAACGLTLPLMMLAPLRAVIRNTHVGIKELTLSASGIIIGALYYRYIPDLGGRIGE